MGLFRKYVWLARAGLMFDHKSGGLASICNVTQVRVFPFDYYLGFWPKESCDTLQAISDRSSIHFLANRFRSLFSEQVDPVCQSRGVGNSHSSRDVVV